MTKVTQCRCLSHQASISSDEHHAIIQSDDTHSIQPDDSIEFLSSQVILVNELPKRPSKSALVQRKYEKPKAEVERKKISRCVALIAFLLLGVCFALMGVSFALTSTIDEMVRNSNTVLRKHNLAGNSQGHVTNESYFH
ncbi:uncharacterized protein LOC133206118 isoform X1 [Saccostrea echinata]|uniref:uncharacterized protein LOC133206118 isoform X1 n=1 Tax=Saccostrea echinata TaxID=191078 RepID=UPI002A8284C9|nr:uncharacterized protein LOC133206118 isoform X1 [Saccostrea echinata]